MNNNLDHLFKKALQDKSCEPPPYIWGNIERQLNKNKHKVALWWWRTAAAAAVVAAFIGIWLFYSVESPEISCRYYRYRNIKNKRFHEFAGYLLRFYTRRKDRSICNEGDGDGSTGFDSTKQED